MKTRSTTLVFYDSLVEKTNCRHTAFPEGVVRHSSKAELRFCAGSNPTRGVSEIRDGEDLGRWSRLANKAKRLSSVNHTTKTIHHHHQKGILRNFAKFTGKHLCQSFFFNKVAGLQARQVF